MAWCLRELSICGVVAALAPVLPTAAPRTGPRTDRVVPKTDWMAEQAEERYFSRQPGRSGLQFRLLCHTRNAWCKHGSLRFLMRMLAMPVLMLSIAACGPSGPGGPGFCVTRNPTVSNLSLSPNSAVLDEGGGSIDVDVTFDYGTRDGAKLLFVDYQLIDASGARVVNAAIDVSALNLKGAGTHTFSTPLPTQTAKTYRFIVRLTDECLSESHWAEANFIVTQPAGAAGKTDAGVARLDRVLYVIGGCDAAGAASDTLLRHDPVTGITTARASMPEGRFSAAIAAYDNLIFVFGGSAFGHLQDSTFVYDSTTDTWTARAPMSRPMAGASAFEIDGMIYIAGDGHVDQYDPVIDSWTQVLIPSKAQ